MPSDPTGCDLPRVTRHTAVSGVSPDVVPWEAMSCYGRRMREAIRQTRHMHLLDEVACVRACVHARMRVLRVCACLCVSRWAVGVCLHTDEHAMCARVAAVGFRVARWGPIGPAHGRRRVAAWCHGPMEPLCPQQWRFTLPSSSGGPSCPVALHLVATGGGHAAGHGTQRHRTISPPYPLPPPNAQDQGINVREKSRAICEVRHASTTGLLALI